MKQNQPKPKGSHVIYQVYPRSFYDTSGNGIGDLNGVIEKLPYLKSLNPDFIWISPFFKSPMKDYGYDVSDYCSVDPLFGDNQDFLKLIEKSKSLGLKIMIDMVLSHTSNEHPWFVESRSSRDNSKADWYVWADPKPDGTPPNNWLSVFGGSAWHWEPRRKQYYLGQFLKQQPATNVHCHEVKQALLDSCRYWLERGVKGIRFDVISFAFNDPLLRNNPPSKRYKKGEPVLLPSDPFGAQNHIYDLDRPEVTGFVQDLRTLANEFDDVFLLGEASVSGKRLKRYVGKDKLHCCYNYDVLNLIDPPNFNAEFRKLLASSLESNTLQDYCWAFSNHDFKRAVSRFTANASKDQKIQAAKCLNLLLMCLKGTVCLYQGEELGLEWSDLDYADIVDPSDLEYYPTGHKRDGSRTPLPWKADAKHCGFSNAEKTWLPVDRKSAPLSIDHQDGDAQSCLSFTKSLINLRKNSPALSDGALVLDTSNDDIVSFFRINKQETLQIVCNISEKSLEFQFDKRDFQPISEFSTINLTEGGNNNIVLPSFSYCLLRKVAHNGHSLPNHGSGRSQSA